MDRYEERGIDIEGEREKANAERERDINEKETLQSHTDKMGERERKYGMFG